MVCADGPYMINFRFHVASLVAVFLALALGVVMGSTVVDRAIVESLRNQIDDVRERARTTRQENDGLRAEVRRLGAYAAAAAPFAVSGRLPGVPVAVVALRGVDENAVGDLVTLVGRAGGRVTAVVWLEVSWELGPDRRDEAGELARLLGIARRSDRVLRDAAARALLARLRDGDGTGGDLLARLEALGFVRTTPVAEGNGGARGGTGTPAARVVLVGGPSAAVGTERLSATLARAAIAVELPAVVAEDARPDDPETPRGTWVAPVRDDEALAGAISTVDALDLSEGRVAAVLAVADLGRGIVGAYGYGPGASGPLPAWWAP